MLTGGLADPWQTCRRYACQGLGDLGAAARPAVPALRKLIHDKLVAGDAIDALSRILGPDANPIILEAYRGGVLDEYGRRSARSAFANHPEPAAMDVMTEAFRRGPGGPDVFAAVYFEKLDRPESLVQFRWALATLKLPEPHKSHQESPNREVVETLRVVLPYLGSKRDPASFDGVLAAASDPSGVVRTAAVAALGQYADARAVGALSALLDERDEGPSFSVEYNRDLQKAAVDALAKTDAPAAHASLYHYVTAGGVGTDDKPLPDSVRRRQQLVRTFWAARSSAAQFEAFLGLYARDPLPDELAAPILAAGLSRQAGYALPADRAAEAARGFYAQVRDEDVVPAPAVRGPFTITPSLAIYRGGYAIYGATFRSRDPRGFGHGTEVLYVQRKGRWVRLGQVGGWTS